MANWIQRFLTAIATHKDDASAHHAKFDIFDKFRDFIPWVSLDAFMVGGDDGYIIEVYGDRLAVEPANQANYNAWIRSDITWWIILDPGRKTTIEIFLLGLDAVSVQNVWIRFAATTPSPPSETTEHFGWKIIDADLYASNADGTTQEITDTDVDLVAGAQKTRLRTVIDPGVDIKFYVNDVLKVTHTENLPDVPNLYFHTHVKVLAPQFRTTHLGRILIEKEYA